MKTINVRVLLGLILFFGLSAASATTSQGLADDKSLEGEGAPAKHVILIVIDGFTPSFYMDASWPVPNLREAMHQGVYAQKGVRGIFPSVTYSSHTSIATGVAPAKHGVYYNTPFEPEGPTGRWHWEYDLIQSPTLWDAAHKKGLKTASLLWPVTYEAPIDYLVPPIWNPNSWDSIDITARSSKPSGIFEEMERNATGKLDTVNFGVAHQRLSRDENIARMAAYLIQTYQPGLLTLNLPLVDGAQHADGTRSERVSRTISGADRGVRTILEAIATAGIQNETAVIIMGDHGFTDIHTQFNPNVLLQQAGLLNDVKIGDWKAQFHTVGGSGFLMLKDPQDRNTLSQVRALLERQPAYKQGRFLILDQEEMASLGASPEAALAVSGTPGVSIGRGFQGEVIQPAVQGGTHGHHPDFPELHAGFIAFGAGIPSGTVLDTLDIRDVSALVAYLLGLDFPSSDGTMPF